MSIQAAQEWPATLEIQRLLDSGWRPAPFREFVVKVHSRCNLSCDYCYMYTLADQGWRQQPLRMSREVIDLCARRISEHTAAHKLSRICVILHGGEPLLAGQDRLERIVVKLRSALPDGTTLRVVLQTNGVLLTSRRLEELDRLGIQLGLSLDGAAVDHDRHRRRRDGQGSYGDVVRGLQLLGGSRFRHLFRGLLCTIDLQADPIETYQALLSFGPPAIDFLLPHGNWAYPPPGLPAFPAAPYAEWLCEIFDSWYGSPAQDVTIRLFDQIIQALLIGRADMEGIGLEPASVVVIETDGSIEQSDFLKSAFSGASATGLHVRDHSFDEALLIPAMAARQIGAAGLSGTCQQCRLRRVCGGGHYAHRYRSGSGFLNPSVYCADLAQLITHIAGRLDADLTRMVGSWRTRM
ncbi:MAG TPA: FxsB family cyclophane-forming radical SAM/SPASM peptide maturase [Streptosporangiaceae bacterium]|nr:FxsB family cyclophane-forming radical SAM/SPASM peptide maturase [Streptosporangiaceae bacterium]